MEHPPASSARPENAALPAGRDPHAQRCGNCGSPLTGPYCAACGQHVHDSARHLHAVLHDAWHDITHVDGRLWHTLRLLLLKPGLLTVDYFQERRARYLPPVRLYLVLSVVFFSLNLSGEQPSARTAAEVPATPAAAGASPAPARTPGHYDADWPCEKINLGGIGMLERPLREACLHNRSDHGVALFSAVVHNIPKMMFVFLPLMAGVMLLLYRRPRRYYVEHLVFLLHNHSALFLCFSLQVLLSVPARLWPRLDVLGDLGGLAAFFYILWYPYAAMRRYYGQPRTLTASKYLVIALAYLACSVLTLLGTVIVTALRS